MNRTIHQQISAIILDETRPAVERMYAVALSASSTEAAGWPSIDQVTAFESEIVALAEGRLDVSLTPHPADPDSHSWRVRLR